MVEHSKEREGQVKTIFRVTVRMDKELYKAMRIKLIAKDSNFTEWLNGAMLKELMKEGEGE